MARTGKRTSRPISEQQEKDSPRRKLPIGWLLVGGMAVLVLLLVVLLVNASQPEPVDAQTYEALPAEWVDGRSLGNPDAPVVIHAWEDFRCPACAQWTQQIKPRLTEDFIQPEGAVNGGAVRLEYHYFPLSSHEPGASLAAQAGECAADQGSFWPYHDRLFAATNQGPAGFTIDRLQSYAGEVGLDASLFSQCLVGQENLAEVQASLNEAISLGLNSTPSLIINGQQVESPFDYNALTNLIQQNTDSDQ